MEGGERDAVWLMPEGPLGFWFESEVAWLEQQQQASSTGSPPQEAGSDALGSEFLLVDEEEDLLVMQLLAQENTGGGHMATRSASAPSLEEPEIRKECHQIYRSVYHELSNLDETRLVENPSYGKDEYEYKYVREYIHKPPTNLVGANVLSTKNDYAYTERIGKYLIDRGFPCIGRGSGTLVFLLTDTLVGKVSRYGGSDVTRDSAPARKHTSERKRDLCMAIRYPTCFAATEIIVVTLSDGSAHDLTVQERLYGPFRVLLDGDEDIRDEKNFVSLREMRRDHEDAKQYAYTHKRRRMPVMVEEKQFITDDGKLLIRLKPPYQLRVSEEEAMETRRWLVCFDYK